ncbi:MAG: tetratricopeptide repeat protein [Desulfobacteraceae bacterium]
MHRQPNDMMRFMARFGWLLGLLLPLVVGGCAAGPAHRSGPVGYGHPFYKHVRHLPENQAEMPTAQDKPTAPSRKMSAQELEQHGDSLLHRGHLAGAYAKYEQALAKRPDNQDIQVKMARVLTMGGFYDDALKLLKTVIHRQPNAAAAWEVMGIVQFGKGTYAKAREYFGKTLAIDPNRWQAYNYQGQIYDIQKEHIMAARAFGKAIALQPRQGFLHNNLGVSNALAGRHRRAVKAFRQAIRLKYTSAKVFNNLGTSLAALGRYAEAFEAFKKGVGEARAHNNLGCMYMLAGRFEAAIQSFERAIAMTPHFYTVAYDNLKKAEVAIQ